jgi:tetratricopeptide (TPR) repeat protein
LNEIERQRLAMQADPSDPLLRYNLAAIAHAGGDPLGALQVLDEALASAPRVARLHYGRACALQSLGRLEEAIGAYRTAAEIEPDFSDAWYGLGTAWQAREATPPGPSPATSASWPSSPAMHQRDT